MPMTGPHLEHESNPGDSDAPFLSPDEHHRIVELSDELAESVTGNSIANHETLARRLVARWPSGWTAEPLLLATFAELAGTQRDPILEIGSGLTTVVLASIVRRTGTAAHVFEHDPWWLRRIRHLTADVSPLTIHHCPIIGYDDYDWYQLPPSLPDRFGLVLCDGPPGTTRGGRAGLVELADRLHEATVLLDDTHRPREREVLQHWRDELGATWTTRKPGAVRTYARKLREARRRASFAVVRLP